MTRPVGERSGHTVRNRVLVTGMPRGGTTFVGTALAFPTAVGYIHEPLNQACGVPGADDYFPQIHSSETSGERPGLADQVRDVLAYRPLLRGAAYPGDSSVRRSAKKVVRGRGPAMLALARATPWSSHALVKDPFAMLSLGWFRSEGIGVVVVVRHPAAIVSSWQRVGWSARNSLGSLQRRGVLADDEADLADRWADDPVRGPALLWRTLMRNVVVEGEVDRPSALRLVRHEDIAADPSGQLAKLRDEFGLPWSKTAELRLLRRTGGGRAAARSGGPTQQLRRRSADVFTSALQQLPSSAIDDVWEVAGPVASAWYEPDRVAT